MTFHEPELYILFAEAVDIIGISSNTCFSDIYFVLQAAMVTERRGFTVK